MTRRGFLAAVLGIAVARKAVLSRPVPKVLYFDTDSVMTDTPIVFDTKRGSDGFVYVTKYFKNSLYGKLGGHREPWNVERRAGWSFQHDD